MDRQVYKTKKVEEQYMEVNVCYGTGGVCDQCAQLVQSDSRADLTVTKFPILCQESCLFVYLLCIPKSFIERVVSIAKSNA